MPHSRLLMPAALGIAVLLAGCAPDPSPADSSVTRPAVTPSASSSRTTPPVPTPTPTPTPTDPPVVVSCDTITTDAFDQLMLQTGWISWETQEEQTGAKPFALFPNGAPEGQIVCRWGLSPDIISDNVFDLAWAPIDSENAVAARQVLEERGFMPIEAVEGIYMTILSGGDRTDADGYGTTYLFTDEDVRWAPTKADTAYITAPGGIG